MTLTICPFSSGIPAGASRNTASPITRFLLPRLKTAGLQAFSGGKAIAFFEIFVHVFPNSMFPVCRSAYYGFCAPPGLAPGKGILRSNQHALGFPVRMQQSARALPIARKLCNPN